MSYYDDEMDNELEIHDADLSEDEREDLRQEIRDEGDSIPIGN